MHHPKKTSTNVRKWGHGSNPLILKRSPRRKSELPDTPKPVATDSVLEQAAYDRLRSELMEKHPGKFVVFVGENMLGPFHDVPAALSAAYRKFGRRAIFLKELVPEKIVY